MELQVRFRNNHEDSAVPGGWEAKVLWHGDPEKEIGRGTYMYDVPPDENRDDFNIVIKPDEKGAHWVLVVLDCEDDCDETNETNNEAWALHWFTRHRTRTMSYQTYSQFLRWPYLVPNAFPLLRHILGL